MVLKKIKKQNIYEIAMLQIKQYIKDSELKPVSYTHLDVYKRQGHSW